MDSSALIKQLNAIYTASLPTTFPAKFSASVLEQLERGRTLSDKQLALVAKLYAEATEACALPEGQNLGAPGQRLVVRLVCTASRRFEAGNAPPRYINTYITHDGMSTLVHWTGSACEVGAAGTYKVTVKKYSVFQGVRQTIVTRVAQEKQAMLI